MKKPPPFEDRCPQCDYTLEGLPDNHHCPECGFAYRSKSFQVFRERQYFWAYVAMPVCAFLPVVGQAITEGTLGANNLVFFGGFTAACIGRVVYDRCRKHNRIAVGEDGIVILRKKREPQQFAWSEIESIRRNVILGVTTIRDRNSCTLTTVGLWFLISSGSTLQAVTAAQEKLGQYRMAHREEDA